MSWNRRIKDTLARWRYRFGAGPDHLRLGEFGENLAVTLLRQEGYRIIERNAIIDRREIDIIAIEGDLLVFIEVKTRSDHRYGTPLEAVDFKQQKRMRKAAELYLLRKKLTKTSLRFDVVTVDFTNHGLTAHPEIDLIRNAF